MKKKTKKLSKEKLREIAIESAKERFKQVRKLQFDCPICNAVNGVCSKCPIAEESKVSDSTLVYSCLDYCIDIERIEQSLSDQLEQWGVLI